MDLGLETFHSPDGSELQLPATWATKRYLKRNPKYFRTCAFRSLVAGDRFLQGTERVPFLIPEGFEVKDLPLKMLERPRRCSSLHEAYSVDKDRLFSVLDAMIAGIPLPPVQVEETDSGFWRVSNGFHRYYASVLLGYTEIPVLTSCPKRGPQEISEANETSHPEVVLTEPTEDGRLVQVAAVVVPPKRPDHAPKAKCSKAELVSIPRPRYEPPAVRKARLEQEAREKREKDLAVKAIELKVKALSRAANCKALCLKIQAGRNGLTYAERASGRKKAASPPSWDDAPPLGY